VSCSRLRRFSGIVNPRFAAQHSLKPQT